MTNITLRVDENVIKKVRKIAIDKNTSLASMVREYLKTVANQDVAKRGKAVDTLLDTFKKNSRIMGQRKWTRESLYER